ncbi:hypothetical protein [Streptomyces althioticus]
MATRAMPPTQMPKKATPMQENARDTSAVRRPWLRAGSSNSTANR